MEYKCLLSKEEKLLFFCLLITHIISLILASTFLFIHCHPSFISLSLFLCLSLSLLSVFLSPSVYLSRSFSPSFPILSCDFLSLFVSISSLFMSVCLSPSFLSKHSISTFSRRYCYLRLPLKNCSLSNFMTYTLKIRYAKSVTAIKFNVYVYFFKIEFNCPR